jgi:hypothetical protein
MKNNETIFECFGCGEKISDPGSIPPEWNTRKIFGKSHLFCRHCCFQMESHPGMEHPVYISDTLRQDLHERHGIVFENNLKEK